MGKIVNTDPLTWIFTSYGLTRITEALADSTVQLNLTKINVGDSNGNYYKPTESQTSLVNQVDSFYIHEITQNTSTNTVTFSTIFTENSSGYDIREIGIFETVNNVDYLFAISTQQPIVKPPVADGYAIAIDYSANLISTNLSSVYNQINIDAQNSYIKEGALDELTNTVLFSSANLSQQISDNTKIIGYDRPTQLSQQMKFNQTLLINAVRGNVFTNLITNVGYENIYNLWMFNTSNKTSQDYSIPTLSSNGINLSLNKSIVNFNSGYMGLAEYLDISDNNYFIITQQNNFNLINTATSKDTPFTLFISLNFNSLSSTNTIINKCNPASNLYEFSITKNSDNSLTIVLYTDKNNYITAKSSGNNYFNSNNHVIMITYNGNSLNPVITGYVDMLTQIQFNIVETGTYTGMTNTTQAVTSYSIDSSNNKLNPINSKISILGIIKGITLDYNNQIKPLLYLLNSYNGNKVCQIF
jgi:hypothetical protein